MISTLEIYNQEDAISKHFLALDIRDYQEASNWIVKLPYQRNTNKNDPLIVLKENRGTCSTKHALLRRLAIENNASQIKLMLGLFEMNERNTPAIKNVLEKYKLNYIPEAHNYLKIDNQIYDFTGLPVHKERFDQALLAEIEISPEQITTFKIDFHKKFMEEWIVNQKISYTLEELWEIREQCILTLSKANLQLETERLFMRPFEEDDADEMMSLNDDPEVLQYTGDVQFENKEILRSFLRNYPQYERYQVGRLLLILKDTKEVLGWCGLKYDEEIGEYDIGYRLFKKHWGYGYATESAATCLAYGFRKLNIKRIIGRARIENIASIRVFEKLNMKFNSNFKEDGENWVLYSINSDEYFAQKV